MGSGDRRCGRFGVDRRDGSGFDPDLVVCCELAQRNSSCRLQPGGKIHYARGGCTGVTWSATRTEPSWKGVVARAWGNAGRRGGERLTPSPVVALCGACHCRRKNTGLLVKCVKTQHWGSLASSTARCRPDPRRVLFTVVCRGTRLPNPPQKKPATVAVRRPTIKTEIRTREKLRP